MLLSRVKTAATSSRTGVIQPNNSLATSVPKLDQFLQQRDYTGAITLLEYEKPSLTDLDKLKQDLWIAYCYFHLTEYEQALEIYEKILNENSLSLNTKLKDKKPSKQKNTDQKKLLAELPLLAAICKFFIGDHQESLNILEQHETSNLSLNLQGSLKRLKLHLTFKLGEGDSSSKFDEQLQDTLQDQLSLASIHYLKAHYQEAIDIYKKCLLENRELSALSVYLALCYYKLDYYDVSQEVLNAYLDKFDGDSLVAVNLKACNHYRLYNGKAAESELRQLIDKCSPAFTYAKELIRHNLVVFRNGELALQVLPKLITVIPEAKLNLIIYYLKQNEIQAAFNLVQDIHPSVPQEYILKAVTATFYAQNVVSAKEMIAAEHLKLAQQYFQLVGASASECDTIPGRQCMASCFFLTKQFDDVLLYLNSIKSYFYNDDTFNFNFAQAKCALNNFQEAEESFLLIKDESIRKDPIYVYWLIRCYILNKSPKLAWDLFKNNESSPEAFNYLLLFANDCYKMGFFYYSAKAFDMMEQIDSGLEYTEGKRGACCGLFQLIIAEKENRQLIPEIISWLQNPSNSTNDQIIKVIKNWENEQKTSF